MNCILLVCSLITYETITPHYAVNRPQRTVPVERSSPGKVSVLGCVLTEEIAVKKIKESRTHIIGSFV